MLPPLFVLHSGAGDPATNMAMDEALLESALRMRAAVLRFYSWTELAASFGYFQYYEEVGRATPLRPLVRRPTGGGIVPHDHDWTYSAVFPPSHPWYGFSAIESYRQIHEWIGHALKRVKVGTQLAVEAQKTTVGQCFVGYEKFDLLWHRQKIAGAAQRRTRNGLLIQGSLQPPPISLNREQWEFAMIESVPVSVATIWKKLDPDAALLARAHELVKAKYALPAYNQKR